MSIAEKTAGTSTPGLPDGHSVRVWCADEDADLYTWRCTCGQRGARDFVHREYARDSDLMNEHGIYPLLDTRDDAREAHGLDPLITYPLV